MEKVSFAIDKVSGMSGSIFGLSPIPDVIRSCNARLPFRFPLYGFSIRTADMKMDEWVDEIQFRVVGNEIVGHVKQYSVDYFKRIKKQITVDAEQLRQEALAVLPKLSTLDDYDLLQEFTRFINLYIYKYAPAVITFVYESVLSERLHE